MSKIDVSKCKYKGGIECHIRDYPILNCADVKIEDCYYKQLQQLKEKNNKIHGENIHYNYLISVYHVCFEGALGAMQELLKNNCKNPKYWANVAKTYLGFRYEEQQEAKNIYDKHFAELKAERDLLLNQLVVLDGEDVTVQITQEQFEEYNKLKTENCELKNEIKEIREDCDVCFNAPTILEQKYESTLNEIEKICNDNNCDNTVCEKCRFNSIDCDIDRRKAVLQKIKEVKGNE